MVRIFLPLVVLLLLHLPGNSYGSTFNIESLDKPTDIAGAWRFQTGDDLAWAAPDFADSSWPSLMVPRDWRLQGYGDHYGMGWYRFELQFDLENPVIYPEIERVGIQIGKIRSAYEIYAGGQFLGGVGKLPPLNEVSYDQKGIYLIPRSAIDPSGVAVIAIRVWREELYCECTEGGLYEGDLRVGTIEDLQLRLGFGEIPSLVLGLLYIIIGIYHLYLFGRNPALRQYLWFGLLTICIGIYVVSVSQWKNYIDLPFLWHKKIEYSLLYVTPALGLSMMWRLLEYRPPIWARACQWLSVLLALLIVVVPNLHVHYLTLTLWQVLAVLVLIGLTMQLMWFALHDNQEAKTVLIGMALFVATVLNDILIDQAMADTPRLAAFGFAAIIIAMATSLANKFTAMYSHLEDEVQSRTHELSELNDQLKEAARIDVLTELLNRRGFAERAEEEILRARRTQRAFALVIADIDKFKAVNDQYGHACGDAILREVAEQLSRQLRDIDVIARWGGEEFVLLLPETGTDGGATLAEKLRALIQNHAFYYRELRLSITMTFGVAGYELSQTLDDCLALADRALYAGKANGRNIVEVERVDAPIVDADFNSTDRFG